MGWSNCGVDSKGREIGYGHESVCDHPDCNTVIDRGLAYACGGDHGTCGGEACEDYFCGEHLYMVDNEAMGFNELHSGQLCAGCLDAAKHVIQEYISGDYYVLTSTDDWHIGVEMTIEQASGYVISGDLRLEYAC